MEGQEYFKCPRCRGRSWLEESNGDIVQRCLCGLHKYIQREVEGLTILTTAVEQEDIRLPALGTKIYKCLLAVADQYPKPINTIDIALKAGLQNKETAALTAMLRIRGLLERVSERRGVVGGSIWILTMPAARQLKVKGE